ncbi:MAG: FkbM family methyltransferase [Chloroflexaceae bacterium]
MLQRISSRLKQLAVRRSSVGEIPKVDFVPFLPDNPVIVEAGAHVGLDTLELARLWKKGTVHAFEPVPVLYRRLRSRTRWQRNVVTYPLALGAHDGLATFFVSSGASNASSSLMEPKEHLLDHPDVAFSQQIEVQVTTLDSWAAVHGIERVDFLWLDMQGFELSVLQAAPRILSKVCAIYTEVFLKESYLKVPLYQEVRAWLAEQGFRVEREVLPWIDAGNVLFVRENRA